MINFNEQVLKPSKIGLGKNYKGIPTPLERLYKRVGYLEQGKFIAIAGRNTSGKISFMDCHYLFSIFNYWYSFDEQHRPPIRIIYVGNKTNFALKVQKWACLYMKNKHQMLLDPMTLVGGVGKRFDMTEPDLLKLEQAGDFFNDIDEILHYVNKAVMPSDIYNIAANYMESLGSLDNNGKFTLSSKHSTQQTFLFIENSKNLVPETDSYSNLVTEKALQRKLKDYIIKLKNIYNITTVLCVPTEVANVRNPKDSEPNYRDLGVFAEDVDLGLVMYNPWAEKNNSYQGYRVEDFVVGANDRLRSVTVVRSNTSSSNLVLPLVFLGECGYVNEMPLPHQQAAIDEKLKALRELT